MQELRQTSLEIPMLCPEVAPAEHTIDELTAIGEGMLVSSQPRESETPNGWAIFAQFLAHDVTNSQRVKRGPARRTNALTPAFDLDCLYGRGPALDAYLYKQNRQRFYVGASEFDLPRVPGSNVALIPDARNDENLFLAQMHRAFMDRHNELVNRIGLSFDQARRELTWSYQWIIRHEFLPKLTGIAPGSTLPETFRTPIRGITREFMGAAFRYGHSVTRESHRINQNVTLEGVTALFPFSVPSHRHVVDWKYQFPFDDTIEPDKQMKIDTALAPSLANLSFVRVGSRNLAVRNLLSGRELQLPTGEALAARLACDPINSTNTPLWYYVLQESDVQENGERLGKLGTFLVLGTFNHLLNNDPEGYTILHRDWTPRHIPTMKALMTGVL